MWYWFLTAWHGNRATESLFWQKTTLRAGLAALCAFLLALLLGRRLIAWLQQRFREPNRSPSPTIEELHRHKHWTPTMGGLFIVGGIVAAMICLGDWSNPFLLPTLVLLGGLTAIGACDDLRKLKHGRGLRARTKAAAQLVVTTCVALLVYRLHRGVAGGLDLSVGGFGTVSLGIWFVPLAVIVMLGFSNAVNLSDGLDGLAGGCLLLAFAAMGVVAYLAGHRELSQYLGIAGVPGAGEMAVVAAAAVGAVLGFLWFNCHPAQVFMGDTGSLPLGGLLGLLAIVSRQELLLLVVGGVFVAEAMSVILQVGYFKWRRQRLLRCAPLHHHFQFLGWPESRIVVRFWIAAALCAVVGLAGLKLSTRGVPNESAADRSAPDRFTRGQDHVIAAGQEE